MTIVDAIKAAQVACDAFSDAVRKAGYKSRWDRIDWESHPDLKAARQAHWDAGIELHEAFTRQREMERAHAAGRIAVGNDIRGI